MRFFIFLFCFVSLRLHGQSFELGLLGGASLLDGDYPSYRLSDSIKILASPGFGAFFRKPFSEKFAIKGSVFISRFKGDDSLIPRFIGLHNPSKIDRPNMELQFNGEYSPIILNKNGKRPITPYIYTGIALSKTTITGSDIVGNCPIINLVIPLGGGIRMPINESFQIFGQLEGMQGLNDCLDGIEGYLKKKDFYYSLKIGVSKTITPVVNNGVNIGCPKF